MIKSIFIRFLPLIFVGYVNLLCSKCFYFHLSQNNLIISLFYASCQSMSWTFTDINGHDPSFHTYFIRISHVFYTYFKRIWHVFETYLTSIWHVFDTYSTWISHVFHTNFTRISHAFRTILKNRTKYMLHEIRVKSHEIGTCCMKHVRNHTITIRYINYDFHIF